VSGRGSNRSLGRVWWEIVDANSFSLINLASLYTDILGDVAGLGIDLRASVYPTHDTYNLGKSNNRFVNLWSQYIYGWTYMKAASNATIATPDNVARQLSFTSHDGTAQRIVFALLGGEGLFLHYSGGAYRNCAYLRNGMFDIPRAGDITFVDDTKSLNWSDVKLYHGGANVLMTDDRFEVKNRVRLYHDTSVIFFGDGAGAWDTNIYRSAANVLKTDDDFTIADGKSLLWSDVNLYRNAVSHLKTDDDFTAVGDITSDGLITAALGFRDGINPGIDTSWVNAEGKTVTVSGGIITSVV